MQSVSEILSDIEAAGGVGLRVEDAACPGPAPAPGVLRLGVDRRGALPEEAEEPFDILLTTAAEAPAPWVGIDAPAMDAAIEELRRRASAAPAAAAAAAQVMRASLTLPFEQALVQESFAYSMLLASAGFGAWRASSPPRPRMNTGRPPSLQRG